ncbi:MAG: hypothetical protein ACOCUA_03185 [archaeon]
MDEPALHEQLRQIKHRQYLIVILLVIPYLVIIAEYIGYAIAGVLYTLIGVIGFSILTVYRRGTRTAVRQ